MYSSAGPRTSRVSALQRATYLSIEVLVKVPQSQIPAGIHNGGRWPVGHLPRLVIHIWTGSEVKANDFFSDPKN